MPSMLIISFVEWSGAFQRPQHMALGFARRGWDVTYVSPDYLHRKSQQVESGIELPPNLNVVRPAALPGGSRLNLVNRINDANLARTIKSSRGEFDAVIFNDPKWATLAASLKARLRLWDCMDDLSAAAPSAEWAEHRELEALHIADRVWTGTASLADRLSGAHAHVRFIPCGVEGERFANPEADETARAQSELRSLFNAEDRNGNASGPLAGYFGALNERVRVDLIEALLAESWNVLLIGPSSSRMAPLPKNPGLRAIGPRPYASLPAYLACMDLALIPYDTQGPHRFLYPVKALEYLAGGKPVLSTPLPDVARFLKDYVVLGESAEEWGRIAREWPSLRADAAARALAGQAYALGRTWGAMIDEMSEELTAAQKAKSTA